MKKVTITLFALFILVTFAYANGRGEMETNVEGIAVVTENAGEAADLAVRTREGNLVQVVIGERDMARLQIRNNEQIQIRGVFLGETDQNRVQAKIFARTMTVAGETSRMEDPVQLTKREREQLREYEALQTRTRTRTRDRTMTGNGENSTGASDGTGTGTGSGNGSGRK